MHIFFEIKSSSHLALRDRTRGTKEDSTSNRRRSSLNFNLSLSLSLSLSLIVSLSLSRLSQEKVLEKAEIRLHSLLVDNYDSIAGTSEEARGRKGKAEGRTETEY